MSKILDFVADNKFNFIATNTYINKTTNKKAYDGLFYEWDKLTFDELNEFYNSNDRYKKQLQLSNGKSYVRKSKTDNQLLIRINDNYLIFDTDTEQEYIKLVKYLRDNDLYQESAITKSFNGITQYYKRHFWFKVEDKERFKDIRTKTGENSLDIFYNPKQSIGEWINSTLDNIPVLNFRNYTTIHGLFYDPLFNNQELDKISISSDTDDDIPDYPLEQKKPIKKTPKTAKKQVENTKNSKEITEIYKLLEGLNKKRWDNYHDWLIIRFVFLNENLDLEIFEEFSRKSKSYNEAKNKEIYKNLKPQKGYTLATLYYWLKMDNKELFNELQKERKDFWKMIEDLNHFNLAKLYYSIQYSKYVRSDKTHWYEYNNYNVLEHKGEKPPTSLLNDISSRLQDYIIEQRNLVLPDDKDYNLKMKHIKLAWTKCGSSPFTKCIIDYLQHLYTVDRLDDLIDANANLLSFDNMVYDYKNKIFRDIEPTDYITKTTKFNLKLKYDNDNEKHNKIKKSLRDQIQKKILEPIFKDVDNKDYWLYTTAKSLFGNSDEVFFIHYGLGRNGKGLLSNILTKILGNYMYSADSTFLTSITKTNAPNSTLANCKGARYILVSEPDDGTNSANFNVEFIKKLTGNDIITCRDLNKSNISYKPQFTPHIQCNKIPTLNKIDDGIKLRMNIIEYPFKFVENPDPKKPNEKQLDKTLKSIDDANFYNEFMLLLIEYANKINIKKPKNIEELTNNYFEENDLTKEWIKTNYIVHDKEDKEYRNKNYKIKVSNLHELFIADKTTQKITLAQFKASMLYNGFEIHIERGYKFFYGLEPKVEDLEDEL